MIAGSITVMKIGTDWLSRPPMNEDIMLFDATMGEFRIGHCREVIAGVQHFVDHTVEDAEDRLERKEPLHYFENVTHWARLKSMQHQLVEANEANAAVKSAPNLQVVS